MDRVVISVVAVLAIVAVALGLPAAFAAASTWKPAHTDVVVGAGVVCAILVCASPIVMAWRGTWPGRQRDADTVKMIDASLRVAQRALPMATKAEADADARAWWNDSPPVFTDTTTGAEDG